MLYGFNFTKLVLLPRLIFTYSNASTFQLLQHQGLYFRCAAHTQSNWWWRVLFQMVR